MLKHCNKIFKTFTFSPLQKKCLQPYWLSYNNSNISFTYTNIRRFSSNDKASGNEEYVNITWVLKDKSELVVKAKVGDSLLEVAHKNDIDLEGACDSSLACSTCHVILDHELYDSLPIPKPEEEDMLDLAYGLTETSRLGCQVIVKKDMEGVKIRLPRATRNMYVDGHKPKHH